MHINKFSKIAGGGANEKFKKKICGCLYIYIYSEKYEE